MAGRQIAETGHSIATNAARGDRPLDELWIAWGPARVRVRNEGARDTPPVRFNIFSLIAAHEYVSSSRTRFSWRDSLATGAMVFDVPDGTVGEVDGVDIRGVARGSIVAVSGEGDFDRTTTLGHELVHVIQADLVVHFISAPIERHMRHQVGLDARAFDAIEISSGLQLFNYEPFRALIEGEAVRLERR